MSIPVPINLHAWIEEHRHLLQPPVGNHALWNGDFLVMIVGGPNRRSDYHVNPREEVFFQLQGDIVLRIMEDGRPRDIHIRQGELFILPARVPHSPQRPANTVGLVLEQPRASSDDHHLRWYCPRCHNVLHDAPFQPVDLGKQIKELLHAFHSNLALRTCSECGEVVPEQP
jgi:3-hydroxyanthranilate 3,4-dioxygenase